MLLFICLIIGVKSRSITNLNDGWKFRKANDATWYPANVPSTVHLDLLDNNLINDPYFEDNILGLYEMELENWEYQLEFSNKDFDYDINELVFEGLDTHADVYLNDLLILQANNQHRTWRILIQNLQEQNTLRIYFHSAPLHDLNQQLVDSPLNLPYNYTYSRKAAYHYGWDWGPRIVTCGIWKDVYLDQYDNGRIVSLHARAVRIYETSVVVEINIETFLVNVALYTIEVQLKGLDEIVIKNQYPLNTVNTKFMYNLSDIELWWPIGQGSQKLYQVQAFLIKNESYVDYMKITTGFRVAQWIQDKDGNASQVSNTFKFRINGRDLYLKGANYIPPDMFMPRALKNPDVYERVFKDSIDAGYNGLRFWGGGQFEYDIFYELADKYGIVIWHDLMFACAMYPGTENFISNVQAELRDNVKRLRIHPSIIMWNGNNEVEIGWKEWGWKTNRVDAETKLLQYWYDQLFLKAIPNVLNELQPEIYYWPTSPSTSVNDVANLTFGDIHYWGVWAASHQIENYTKFIGRFNSEYGMQAMIDVNSFKKAVPKSYDHSFDSPIFQIHERHIKGIPLLKEYLKNYTRSGNTFIELTYCSQIVQYLSLQTAISALRASKPYNMGSFYWQINDVWPVISWATVDYYGCWKSGHYAAKKYHSDPALVVTQNEDQFKVYLVNDLPRTFTGNVTLDLRQYNGYQVKQWKYNYQEISSNASKLLLNYYVENYTKIFNQVYLALSFSCAEANCDYHGTYNFGRPLQWQLMNPEINYQVDGSTITFTSKNFAKYIYVYGNDDCLSLSDNFFDLLPDVPYRITLKEKKKFSFISYYDLIKSVAQVNDSILSSVIGPLLLYAIL